MTKDINDTQWDSATLTKLKVLESYVDEWLNITLNYGQNYTAFDTLEIYDLFCGSGFDGTKTKKGSPLRILDAVLKRNRKGKTIKIYFNDNNENKIKELQGFIEKEYKNLRDNKVELEFSCHNVATYSISSKNYYKLIFLDQYGIQHINKVDEFLRKGTDILIFVSSGHCRRFLGEESFQKYLDSEFISKKDFKNKPNYETHRIIAKYFKKKYKGSYIAPFSLVKDNENINGLIFISNHSKGQEQFLKIAWAVDKEFGEGNRNLDRDCTKDKNSLFYDSNEPSEKEKRYKELLIEFLQEAKTNTQIKKFGLDNGFLSTHTNKLLKEIEHNLNCEYHNGAIRGFHLDSENKKVSIRYNNETH